MGCWVGVWVERLGSSVYAPTTTPGNSWLFRAAGRNVRQALFVWEVGEWGVGGFSSNDSVAREVQQKIHLADLLVSEGGWSGWANWPLILEEWDEVGLAGEPG